MRTFALGFGLMTLLAACAPDSPMVGGPCSYESSIITATVAEVEEGGAVFNGPDGEFWVSASYLGTPPKVGDTLTLRLDRIVEGTCTPEIFSVIDPDTGDID